MYFPYAKGKKKTRRQSVRLGGLDRTGSAADGALTDSRGLSARLWPCLTQRRGRELVRAVREPTGLFAWGKLWTVEEGALLADGRQVAALTPGEKRFAVVSGKLCIFPDKKYLDLETMELHDLGARAVSTVRAVFDSDSLTLSTAVGQATPYAGSYRMFAEYNYGVVEEFISEFEVWDAVHWDRELNYFREATYLSTDPGQVVRVNDTVRPGELVGKCVIFKDTPTGHVLNTALYHKTYAPDTNDGYIRNYTAYNSKGLYGKIVDANLVSSVDPEVQINWRLELTVEVHDVSAAGDLETLFAPGDTVRISGCESLTANNREAKVLQIEGETLGFDAPGFLPGAETGAVTVERPIPDLDFLCESGGRLFGVEGQTIYVSAPGDPTNFFAREGRPTDGWSAQVRTDGAFTGCVPYGGGVLFFKEDCVHRLMGASPSAYQLYVDHIAGVQAGSAASTAVLDGVLYYKGREGVYAYTGSTPKLISAPLGEVRYQNAVAGADGRRYCISMERTDGGGWELLTYDVRTGLWMLEEGRRALGFARLGGTLYLLDAAGVWALDRGEDDQGSPIPWEATFAPFDETDPEYKYPSRLLLRLELEEGAWVEAEVARDNGPFQTLWTGRDPSALAVSIPIRPGRCRRWQLRLRGEGRCLLRGMVRELSLGGAR